MIDRVFYKPRDVAPMIGQTLDMTYRLLKSGKLKSYRPTGPRGCYVVSGEQIEEFLQSVETEEQAPRPRETSKRRFRPGVRLDGKPFRHKG